MKIKSATVFIIVIVFSIFLILLDGIINFFLVGRNAQDARIINYTGYIGGNTQRLVKLQLAGHYAEVEKLTKDIDELIIGLVKGSKALRLQGAVDGAYITQMQKVSASWIILKQKIAAAKNNPAMVEDLVRESENYFTVTDNAVLAEQNFSERKINTAETTQLIFTFSELSALFVIAYRTNKRFVKEDKLVDELAIFKAATDGVSEHIIFTDPEGVVMYANKAVELVTGYSVKEVVGKKAGQLWGKHMDKGFYDEMWKTIKKDKRVFSGIVKNIRKNGESYDAAIDISPILDKSGEPIFFVGIEKDVTKDIALDRSKTEFVSLASHQLRTPLTAIRWYTELLLNGEAGKLAKKQAEYLGEVSGETRRMIELVNSLLDVSRMELGTFEINSEMADVCGILESVIKDLKPSLIKSKIDLEYTCDKEIPKLLVDIKLTSFIFQNILSNAIKYSRERGVVKVEVKLLEKEVRVSVADKGLGIPEKQKKEIFTKFFRADNVRIKDTEGSGLGLYLVKTILGSIGGEAWFESKENVGSTFYVSIPLTGMKDRKGEKSIIKV